MGNTSIDCERSIIGKTLVFGSAGISAYAYLGSLFYLKNNQLLDDITRFIGSGTGAFIAGLLAMGINGEALTLLIPQVSFVNFRDISQLYGLFSSDRPFCFIKNCFELVTKLTAMQGNPTFMELFERTGRRVDLVATRHSTAESMVLNHLETPDLTIAQGIMMSLATPGAFEKQLYRGEVILGGMFSNPLPLNLLEPDEPGYIFAIDHDLSDDLVDYYLKSFLTPIRVLQHDNLKRYRTDRMIRCIIRLSSVLSVSAKEYRPMFTTGYRRIQQILNQQYTQQIHDRYQTE